MKLRALAVLALAVSVIGCSSTPKGPQPSPLPAIKSSTDLRSLWRGSVSASEDAMLQPIVVKDSVYAAGRNGALVRYDQGREVWRAKAIPNLSGGVASDGEVVAVGSSDGQLQVLDAARGGERWKINVGGEVLGTPLVTGGGVVVRIGDNQIAAYNVTDGKRKWIYQRAQSPLALRTFTGFARSGDLILTGFPGGKLVAVTLQGGFPRWEATIALPRGSNELERMADVVGSPVVAGDVVCVAAFQGRVACVDRESGVVRWARDFSSGVGIDADEKAVFLTDASGAVHALDVHTGATMWKQDKLMYRGVGRPLIVGAYVSVADTEGWIHLLDRADGQFAAQTRADSAGVSAPLVSIPGGFVVQARNGALNAFSPR